MLLLFKSYHKMNDNSIAVFALGNALQPIILTVRIVTITSVGGFEVLNCFKKRFAVIRLSSTPPLVSNKSSVSFFMKTVALSQVVK